MTGSISPRPVGQSRRCARARAELRAAPGACPAWRASAHRVVELAPDPFGPPHERLAPEHARRGPRQPQPDLRQPRQALAVLVEESHADAALGTRRAPSRGQDAQGGVGGPGDRGPTAPWRAKHVALDMAVIADRDAGRLGTGQAPDRLAAVLAGSRSIEPLDRVDVLRLEPPATIGLIRGRQADRLEDVVLALELEAHP